MSTPLSEGDLNEIRQAIFAGRKIEAIRLYREFSGEGLKEAKDAVEEMERELRVESPGRFVVEKPDGGQQQEAKSSKSVPGVQAGKGCFGVLVCLVTAALTLVAVVVCV